METYPSISLQKYTSKDFENYFQIVSDAAVMKYITYNAMSRLQAKQKFEEILKINHDENGLLGYFYVLSTDLKEIIGDCKLISYPKM